MIEKHKTRSSLDDLVNSNHQADPPKHVNDEVIFQPALRQLGTTDCPVCTHEVAVLLTKTNRPFINCSFCSARIFYNGREGMRRLKRNLVPVEN
jgi:DNA-directed RNA polymerase subunit RPC12/RpoP